MNIFYPAPRATHGLYYEISSLIISLFNNEKKFGSQTSDNMEK